MSWRLVAFAIFAGAMHAHADADVQSRLLLQVSFVTGFQYYEGKRVFARLRVGDEVQLVREADHSQDANAIRVDWNSHVLGYLPRTENTALARQMDFGNRLRGRIVRLSRHRDPNRRVEVQVYLKY